MTTGDAPIAVLIMEDHPVFQHRLSGIMQSWPRCGALFTCFSVGEAKNLIDCNRIDLLLADLKLPDGSGVEVVAELRKQQPDAQALVISALANREIILDALLAGAAGYIHKEDSSTGIIQAVEQVLQGGSPLSPGIAREILGFLSSHHPPPAESASPTEHSNGLLTEREQEVLQAISRGYTNREVGELLNISASTVPVHVRNIYRKLEVKNRTEAVFEARKLGIIDA